MTTEKRLDRRDFLRLSALTTAGIAIAGCAPKATPTPKAEEATATSPPPTERPAVEVDWHTCLHQAKPDAVAKVEDALAKMFQERGVNARVNFVNYEGGFGALGEKMNLKFAAGEVVDIVWTGSWANNFYTHSRNGDFLALDDLLPKYAPDLWDKFSPQVWNVGRVAGELYGIPNQQIWVKTWGPNIRKDILEKYPLDWDKINEPRDLEPYMDKVLESEDLKSFFDGDKVFFDVGAPDLGIVAPYESIPGAPGVGIDSTDPERKAFQMAVKSEYLELAKLERDWVEKGYLMEKPLDEAEAKALWDQDAFAGFWHLTKPMEYGVPQPNKNDHIFVGKHGGLLKKLILKTSGINATMTAIGSTCEHPEAALKILNLAHTDPQVFNTIIYGVEGVHWEWVDKDKKLVTYPEGVDASSTPYLQRNWAMGDTFNAYYFDAGLAETDCWAVTRELNMELAKPSVVLGFVFDPEPVETQIAQLSAVAEEFEAPLQFGDIEDVEAGVNELIEKQKEAGIEKVIEEAQKQIDEWAATLE